MSVVYVEAFLQVGRWRDGQWAAIAQGPCQFSDSRRSAKQLILFDFFGGKSAGGGGTFRGFRIRLCAQAEISAAR
jgi:hypothetical protein